MRNANFEPSSNFAPVMTIFLDAKIKAVVLGSRIFMMTGETRLKWTNAGTVHTQQSKRDANLRVIFRIAGV